MKDNYPVLAVARCCMNWPVIIGDPIAPCPFCGETPTLTDVRSK